MSQRLKSLRKLDTAVSRDRDAIIDKLDEFIAATVLE
jgi:hypothetical protein